MPTKMRTPNTNTTNKPLRAFLFFHIMRKKSVPVKNAWRKKQKKLKRKRITKQAGDFYDLSHLATQPSLPPSFSTTLAGALPFVVAHHPGTVTTVDTNPDDYVHEDQGGATTQIIQTSPESPKAPDYETYYENETDYQKWLMWNWFAHPAMAYNADKLTSLVPIETQKEYLAYLANIEAHQKDHLKPSDKPPDIPYPPGDNPNSAHQWNRPEDNNVNTTTTITLNEDEEDEEDDWRTKEADAFALYLKEKEAMHNQNPQAKAAINGLID